MAACKLVCSLAPAAPASPRRQLGSAARPRLLPAAALQQAAPQVGAIAPARPAEQLASNIVPATTEREGLSRKLELQAQARAALEAEHNWWKDEVGAPPNLVSASTKAEYKAAILKAAPNQLVVVDYLKPSCGACRRLFPKLQQIAAQNPDALFVKVNVDLSPEMRELGQGMGVTHLPWFHIWRGGELVTSFSASVTTVATLRAEIAAHKACEHPACSDH